MKPVGLLASLLYKRTVYESATADHQTESSMKEGATNSS